MKAIYEHSKYAHPFKDCVNSSISFAVLVSLITNIQSCQALCNSFGACLLYAHHRCPWWISCSQNVKRNISWKNFRSDVWLRSFLNNFFQLLASSSKFSHLDPIDDDVSRNCDGLLTLFFNDEKLCSGGKTFRKIKNNTTVSCSYFGFSFLTALVSRLSWIWESFFFFNIFWKHNRLSFDYIFNWVFVFLQKRRSRNSEDIIFKQNHKR